MIKLLKSIFPGQLSKALKARTAVRAFPYPLTGEAGSGAEIAIRAAQQSNVVVIAEAEKQACIYVTEEFRSSDIFIAVHRRVLELGWNAIIKNESGSFIRSKYGTSANVFGDGIDDNKKSSNTAYFESLLIEAINERARELRFHVRHEHCGIVHNIDGEVFHVASISGPLGNDLCSNAYTNMADKTSFEPGKGTFSESIDQSCTIDLVLPIGHYRLRYQSMPEDDGGYDVTLRIQPHSEADSAPSLEKLGLTPASIKAVRRVCDNPKGAAYITGPMGQGKTTTLYAAMYKPKDQRTEYVMTFEDPVEYKNFGMTRVPVAKIGYLNAIERGLRMGIHKALIGEIRDEEMGQMASVFSQTGLKVFSTLHVLGANNCIDRLSSVEVKIPRQIICDTDMVAGFIYQRLLPKLCKCALPATEEALGADMLRELNRLEIPITKMRIRNASGCFKGDGTRYCKNGRYGSQIVLEVIEPDATYMRLMRQGLDGDAKEYWHSWCNSSVTEDDVTGKPIIANALYHVACGTIDVFDMERHLGWISQYRPHQSQKVSSLPLKVSN